MAKIQPIERCIGCGAQIKPLISENKEKWTRLRTFVTERIEIPKDKHIEILTDRTMIHDKADIIYFLCSNCCRDALHQFLPQLIARHSKILFQKFDEIKKELK